MEAVSQTIRCPRCKSFVMRVDCLGASPGSQTAFRLDTNCKNEKCGQQIVFDLYFSGANGAPKKSVDAPKS